MRASLPTRKLERRLWARGFTRVAGVDEVGRGPLAGPVTVAAVVLPVRCKLASVQDSKRLTPERRVAAAREVRLAALDVGLGWASSQEIDELGLSAALRLAGRRALGQLGSCDLVVLDGSHNYLGEDHLVEAHVKADQTCLAVAAASVVAKVARDAYMELVARRYPEFGFEANKGYGTASHLGAMRQHGLTAYHRRSWRSARELHAAN